MTRGLKAVIPGVGRSIRVKADEIESGAVEAAALGVGVLVPEYLGIPDLAVDDHFLNSIDMQATAYTLTATTLPAGNPPRTLTFTHTSDGGADTLGNVVVEGTDGEDAVITETVALVAASAVTSLKAFKTVTSVITAGWVTNGAADQIKVGFGAGLGLTRRLTADAQVFLAMLAGLVRLPDAISTDVTDIALNWISLTGGTYDGAKEARAILVL